MWIRLQNKEALVYANNFYIMKTRGEEKYEISYFDGDSFVKLGFYKSKERAIEVLDEIQYKIQCLNDDVYLEKSKNNVKTCTIINNFGYDEKFRKQHKDNVYQMPEE